MKITKSQLKTIILEEAAKVKKAISLKKQLQEVQQQLDEVLGGPHGEGKKTFKKAEGGFPETKGALVEKQDEEDECYGMEESHHMEEEGHHMEEEGHHMEEEGHEMPEEESYNFSEEELEEMLKMSDEEEMEEGHHMEEEGAHHEEEELEEASKTSDPFTVDAPKQFQLKESSEILRMKKLAGLL